ncbi:MAG: efflux RND transporter periplasmic adaptor subunit [Planctomycetota bacterium]|nr:efflux RND transporter periplasmic adaptor subunit [Planctomycetota bacterium]MDA1137818.1 efflux RND transporter periplasmic adaptor subunit [Planctomycetota bacterium]
MNPYFIKTTSLLSILSLYVTDLAAESPPSQPVRVDVARKENLQQRRFILGELQATRRSIVASRESGIVSLLHFKEGQRLRKGDLLVTLDDERLQLDVLEAREDEKVAQAVIKEHQAEMKLREWKFETFQELKKRGSGQESEIREAESALAVTQARIVLAQQQLGVVQAKIARLEHRLVDMKIKAPFDCQIVSKLTEEGQWLADGGKVAEIVSTGEIEAKFEVPERLAQHLTQSDAPISVTVEALQGRVFEADSFRSIPDVHPRSKTFPLIVRLNNGGDLLHSGMTSMAWLPTGETKEQTTISRDAVLWNDQGPFVVVARKEKGGTPVNAEFIPISILFYKSDRVIIQSLKISDGDLIVVEGNERLVPGTPLRITSSSEAKKEMDGQKTAKE